ncbi:MAG: hypothetical protein Q9165_001287 [Trypethelium subeluteriae]
MDELDPDLYTVAWLAPLEIEAKAALHMLDKRHQGRFPMVRGNDYVYQAGEMCGHNTIVATFPAGEEYGTGSAGRLASQVKSFFPNSWFGLLVGIAAGLPSLSRIPSLDIRLGDVLVALPDGESAGLIAYDLGKETEKEGFRLLRSGYLLAKTDVVVRSAIGKIKLMAPDDAQLFLPYYESMKHKSMALETREYAIGTFAAPGAEHDKLYQLSDSLQEHIVERERRQEAQRVHVWYGPIGSGEKLIKNAQKRNELRDKHKLIGLEMEAAGTINSIPVGVIRVVSDYGDEHKNDEWQPYAAAMAAAYAKAVIRELQPRLKRKRDNIEPRRRRKKRTKKAIQWSPRGKHRLKKILAFLKSLSFLQMDTRENSIDDAADDTCQWLFQNSHYVQWSQDSSSLLWIKGKPGAGKSTLLKHALKQGHGHTHVASFFFNVRGHELEKTALGLYRSILHQLLPSAPETMSSLAMANARRCSTRGKVGKDWNWNEKELKNHLADLLLEMAVCPIRLYVDALDESGKEVAVELVYEFSMLIRRAKSSGKYLGICFSCRHYPSAMSTSDGFTICVEDENSTDLKMFVYHRLEMNCISDDKANLLATHILDKACGVLQWVKLVLPKAIDSCMIGTRTRTILKEIEALPSELHDLYEKIIVEIPGEEISESLKLLRWIRFAICPLSVGELRDAMAVDADPSCTTFTECMEADSSAESDEDMEKKILHLSIGLAEIRMNNFHQGYVQLIHKSVNDFLVPDGLQLLDPINHDAAPSRAHLHLASTCLRYLAMADVSVAAENELNFIYQPASLSLQYGYTDCGEQHVISSPFMHYATDLWIEHMQKADKEVALQQELFCFFTQFISPHESRLEILG